MKQPGFTFEETFPLIGEAINSSHRDLKRFVSRSEIVAWLLNDGYGKTLVEAARAARTVHKPGERDKPPPDEAGNMVDWFSATWTRTKGEDPIWAGLFKKFKRDRSCGSYRYKPRSGLSEVEIIREGAMVQVFVNKYERDPRARAKCIDKYGAVCYICGFSFRAAYGEVADGIIHVHHLRPNAVIGEEHEVDPIKDLRPVCPNCHSVLHWRIPAYSIREVQAFLRRAKAPSAKPKQRGSAAET